MDSASLATAPRTGGSPRPPGGRTRPRSHIGRVAAASLALLLSYWSLSFLLDTTAFLGPDTGAKVATLEAMDARGAFLDPDVGYWAAEYDEDGLLHPLFTTRPVGDRWVAVTTFPMLLAARPLHALGGVRAALLLPMLGGVLVALAARALAERLSPGCGWFAFWVVGLTSPVVLYSLDFWEHTLGLAGMAWGVVLLLDVWDGRGGWRAALGAGLLFGAAATMRTEALVFAGAAAVLVFGSALARERDLVRLAPASAAMLAGLAVPLVLNQLLEVTVLEDAVRAGRVGSTAGAAGLDLGFRVEQGLTMTLGLNVASPVLDSALAVVAFGPAAVSAWLVRYRPLAERSARILLLVSFLLVIVLLVADGSRYVPGLLTAAPLAAVGLAFIAIPTRNRLLASIALVPIPIVWLTAFRGEQAGQWGGRYLLLSGWVLAVLACIEIGRMDRTWRVRFVALAGVVTAFGLAFVSVRTHDVARAGEEIASLDVPVVVSRDAFLLREFGFEYGGTDALTAHGSAAVEELSGVLRDAGIDQFAVLEHEDNASPIEIAGYTPAESATLQLVGDAELRVTTYQGMEP